MLFQSPISPLSVFDYDLEVNWRDLEEFYDNSTDNVTVTAAPTFAVDDDEPTGIAPAFLTLNFGLQVIIVYLLLFSIFAPSILLWWRFYPLPPDERVSFFTLLAALWSVFVLVGDYYSDVMVTLALLVAVRDDNEDNPDLDNFSRVVIGISTTALVIAIFAMAYIGAKNSGVSWSNLIGRIIFVALGVYPFYLLFEIVTAKYYGGMRPKLEDIVRLKYIQGTVEGVPQIGLLLFLVLQNLTGLSELVSVSLAFSIISLVSGIVMWDYVREVFGKDEYLGSENDVNYLFYSEHLSKFRDVNISIWAQKEFFSWLFHNLFTRFLECTARLGFYASIALVTAGWGLIGWIAFDIILQLRYHNFTFILRVWLELIFNFLDEGNVNIAYGEWKWKFISTVLGYIVIAVRLGNDPELIDINEVSDPPAVIFYTGLTANVVLFPWIFYMFRRQGKIMRPMGEEEAFRNALESSAVLPGVRVFESKEELSHHSDESPFQSFFSWFKMH